MQITAALVKELKKETSRGILECKAALEEYKDYDLAKFYLDHFAGLAVVVHLKKKEEAKN